MRASGRVHCVALLRKPSVIFPLVRLYWLGSVSEAHRIEACVTSRVHFPIGIRLENTDLSVLLDMAEKIRLQVVGLKGLLRNDRRILLCR